MGFVWLFVLPFFFYLLLLVRMPVALYISLFSPLSIPSFFLGRGGGGGVTSFTGLPLLDTETHIYTHKTHTRPTLHHPHTDAIRPLHPPPSTHTHTHTHHTHTHTHTPASSPPPPPSSRTHKHARARGARANKERERETDRQRKRLRQRQREADRHR